MYGNPPKGAARVASQIASVPIILATLGGVRNLAKAVVSGTHWRYADRGSAVSIYYESDFLARHSAESLAFVNIVGVVLAQERR